MTCSIIVQMQVDNFTKIDLIISNKNIMFSVAFLCSFVC